MLSTMRCVRMLLRMDDVRERLLLVRAQDHARGPSPPPPAPGGCQVLPYRGPVCDAPDPQSLATHALRSPDKMEGSVEYYEVNTAI